MPLTRFGFIVKGDHFEQRQGTEAFRMHVVGVRSPDEGIAVARRMVAEGVQLIELCGAFGPVWAGRIIDAIGLEVPVGFVAYGGESIDAMHRLFAPTTFRRFEAADFETYRSWYEDVELNRQLGPMDDDWLKHILSSEDDGQQFAYLEAGALAAVVGVIWHPDESAWVVTDIAVDPARRRQGLGRRAIEVLAKCPELAPQGALMAHVVPGNPGARAFFDRLGWQCTAEPTPEDDMFTFRCRPASGS